MSRTDNRAVGAGGRQAGFLRLLLGSETPRSGQEMAGLLGVSRAAVGKLAAALRAQGFEIAARPRMGYQLIKEPKDVLPARVLARIRPGGLGEPFFHFASIDSTNLEARRRAEAGAPHGACLAAEHQSGGRGRLDRRWLCPKGSGLLFSLILRPDIGLSEVFGLTNLAALALCRVLEKACGLKPAVKWPNDVFLDGHKLAGVLTEFTSRAERLEFAVVGVGLNVNLTPAQLAKLPAPAASLRAATGKVWDRAEILAGFLAEADGLYERFISGGRQGLTSEYNQRLLILDRKVSVRDGDRVLEGVARGVEPDGALLLEVKPKKLVTVRHGDVSLLKYD